MNTVESKIKEAIYGSPDNSIERCAAITQEVATGYAEWKENITPGQFGLILGTYPEMTTYDALYEYFINNIYEK